MDDYNIYLNKLKKVRSDIDYSDIDYDYIYTRLEKKIARRPVYRLGLALGATLAVLLLVFTVYLNYPAGQTNNGETIMAYVFEQENVNGNSVNAYVFGD